MGLINYLQEKIEPYIENPKEILDGTDDSTKAKIIRGLAYTGSKTLSYANALKKAVGGDEVYDSKKIDELQKEVEAVKEKRLDKDRTPQRKEEVAALNEAAQKATSTKDVVISFGNQLFDAVTHPNEWTIEGAIQNFSPTDLANIAGAGAGSYLAKKGITLASKIALGAAGGAIEGGIIGSGSEALNAYGKGDSNEEIKKAAIGGAVGGSATGGVVGGGLGAFTKNPKPKEQSAISDNAKLFDVEEIHEDDIVEHIPKSKDGVKSNLDSGVHIDEEGIPVIVVKKAAKEKVETSPDAKETIDNIVQARAEAMNKSKEELLQDKPLEVVDHNAAKVEDKADSNQNVDINKKVDENPGVLYQKKLSEDRGEINSFFNENAEPMRKFGVENIQEEFNANSFKDPLGKDVEVPSKLILKNIGNGREQYLGMLRPSIEKPLMIIEHNGADIYVKSFTDFDSVKKFAAVEFNGDSVSFHIIETGKIDNRIKEGKITYIAPDARFSAGSIFETNGLPRQDLNPKGDGKTIPQNTQTVKGSVKGMFEKFGNKGVITLFSNSDMTTVFHEAAHYLETTFTKEERVAFDEAFGGYKAKRARSEAFAEGFVKWAATGEAKNSTIRSVFEKTREFLREVLNSLRNSKEAKFKLTASQELFYRAVFGDEEAKAYFAKALEKREANKPKDTSVKNSSILYQDGESAVVNLDKFAEPIPEDINVFKFLIDFQNKIKTPIGNFKINTDYILNKLAERDAGKRFDFISYIKPTLERPAYIILHDNKFHFIKPFFDKEENVKKFLSVISDRDGLVQFITSTPQKDNDIKKLLSNGKVIADFTLEGGATELSPVPPRADLQSPADSNSMDKSISQETRLFQEGVQDTQKSGFALPNAMPVYNFLSDFLRAQGKVGKDTKALLSKAGLDKLYEASGRNLIYGGTRANKVIDAFSAYKIEQSAKGNRATDIYKALKKLSSSDREALHLALSGDMEASKLSSSLQTTYGSLRSIIDANAKELVELGELKADDSIEHYLKRTYVKDLKEASSILGSITKSGGSVDHIKARRGKEATRTLSAEDVDKYNIGGIFKTKSGHEWAIENKILTNDGGAKLTLRRDYTFDERTQMGEIRDAAFSVWYTLQKQNSQIARAKLLNKIPTKAFESEDAAKAAGFEKVPDEATADRFKLYGSLGGKYIRKAYKGDLDFYLNIASSSGKAADAFRLFTVWEKITSVMKINDTVKNFSTHLNNTMSNIALISLNDPTAFANLAKVPSLIKAHKRLRELGYVEGEMSDIESDVYKEFGNDASENTNILFDGITRAIRELFFMKGSTLGEAARTVYKLEDSIFKAAVFARKLDEGFNEDAALRYISDNYVDYNKPLPAVIRELDNKGVLPFVGFSVRSAPVALRAIVNHPIRFALYMTALGASGLRPTDKEEELLPVWGKSMANIFFVPKFLVWDNGAYLEGLNVGRWVIGMRSNPFETISNWFDPLSGDDIWEQKLGYVGSLVKAWSSANPNDKKGFTDRILETYKEVAPNYAGKLIGDLYNADKGKIDPLSHKAITKKEVLKDYFLGKDLEIHKAAATKKLFESKERALKQSVLDVAYGKKDIEAVVLEYERAKKSAKEFGIGIKAVSVDELKNAVIEKIKNEALKVSENKNLSPDEKQVKMKQLKNGYEKLKK